MAKYCLVTKLKGTVSNDDIERYGYIYMPLEPYSGIRRVQVGYDTAFTAKLKGDAHFYSQDGATDLGQTLSFPSGNSNMWIKDPSAGDILSLSDKKSMTLFSLVYAGNGNFVIQTGADVDWSGLVSFKNLNTNNNFNPKFNINTIGEFSKDIETLALQYASNANGSIETMVEGLVGLGRDSGTIDLAGYNSQITLNGNVFFNVYADRAEHMTITFSDGTVTCTWKGNVIATYSGGTWTYA